MLQKQILFNEILFTSAMLLYISAADTDYLGVQEPLVFRINGESRICLEVTILTDTIRPEYYETFLVQLTSTSNPLFAPQAVVVILDPG